MPLTSTYLKQMKLRVMNSQEQVRRQSPLTPPGDAPTCLDVADAFQDVGTACVNTQGIKEALIWLSGRRGPG